MGCGGSKGGDGAPADAGDIDVKIQNERSPNPPGGNKAAKAAKAEADAKARAEADAKARAEADAKARAQAQAAKEAKAATMVQAAVRGHADRAMVELMKHACGHYRVNMQAENFGDCQCGWPKAAHSADAFKAREKTKPPERVGSAELRARMLQKDKCACERYQVNMASANFGECMCGRPKADHTTAALSAGEKAVAVRVDSADARAKMVKREMADCLCYEVKMGDNSVAFGTCVCGRPRAEHTEAALTAKTGTGTTRRDSAEVRKKFVQKQYAGCDRYEVKLGDNSAAFGTCACGKLRAEHSPEALAAGVEGHEAQQVRDSAVVRAGFEKTAAWADRETCDCPRFELDLDPNAAFGTCKCGVHKSKHSDAALA